MPNPPPSAPAPAVPHAPGSPNASVPQVALTTPAFPKVYPNPLTPDQNLQKVLDDAIKAGPGTSWTVPVAIVFLDPGASSRPMAQFKGPEMDYSASLLKVAAMYAAFELRKTVRAVAAELGTQTTQQDLLRDVARFLDPKILAMAATIPALNGIANTNALPQYAKVFDVVAATSGAGFTVSFKDTYWKSGGTPGDSNASAMQLMIEQSVNLKAAQVIQGLGYGYLNGALTSAGFLSGGVGLWLGGDYSRDITTGKSQYPYFRVPSVNDQQVAQGATVLALAREFTLIADDLLVDAASCAEMREVTALAVSFGEVFLNRGSGPLHFKITNTKVGLGPLKSGSLVSSEASLVLHDSGRKFVVAWQNLQGSLDPTSHVVRDVLDKFTPGASTTATTPATP